MKVKNGIASRSSLEMMPCTRSGNACSNCQSKWPVRMPSPPKKRPTAPRENATGKPISMKQIIPRNISGGMMP